MQVTDINAEESFSAWAKLIDNGVTTLSQGDQAEIKMSKQGDFIYSFKCAEGKNVYFTLVEEQDNHELTRLLASRYKILAQIVATVSNQIELKIVALLPADALGDLAIELEDKMLKENNITFDQLKELCTLNLAGKNYFIFMAGPAVIEDFEEEKAQVTQNLKAFSIHAKGLRIAVKLTKENKLAVSKLPPSKTYKKEGSLRLSHGTLHFTSQSERISSATKEQLEKITEESDSYLKTWDNYATLEGEELLKQAQEVGILNILKREDVKGGIKVFFDNNIKEQQLASLAKGDSVELITASERPNYLNKDLDLKIAWKEYLLEQSSKSRNICMAEITVKSENSLTLKMENGMDLEQRDTLIFSMRGEKTQEKRRIQARERIRMGRSANPQLGLLIEPKAKLAGKTSKANKIKPLTKFVKEKIFKQEPTPNQIKAIEIALNTPDIALIQGPPGTGKTTVVTAILERLNEEFDKRGQVQGKILISAYQHDAVENIIQRLSINALPTHKFGAKAGKDDFVESNSEAKITLWGDNLIEKLKEKNPKIIEQQEHKQILMAFEIYEKSPSRHHAQQLLQYILSLPISIVKKEDREQAKTIQQELDPVYNKGDENALRLLYALRTEEESFKDDGAKQALAVLEKLKQELTPEQIKLLDKASRWQDGNTLDFLNELSQLKNALLLQYRELPRYDIEKPQENIRQLVKSVITSLKESMRKGDQKENILADFCDDLQNNPIGVHKAITDYNVVYASTVQQSAGNELSKFKKLNFSTLSDKASRDISFDVVIIDEAARVGPRDLLIPLAMGKRIILVGDHRQLPHMVEEHLAKQLEEQSDESQTISEDLKKSMFEHFLPRLEELEKEDGISRVITLNNQYRTHPVLGEFASENFYKPYKEEYASPRPASEFTHQLSGIQDKAAIWIDVKSRSGVAEKTEAYSWRRQAEVKAIVEYLVTWLGDPEPSEGWAKESLLTRPLSFGIISFYKAQIEEIYAELAKKDIAKKVGDSWEISKAYRFLPDGSERLRIGSVDAFQGMEFDVVLLSIVRSQPNVVKPVIDEEQLIKQIQSTFGFLTSKNRLCVSMTRQKKALIVVGDAMLCNSELAQKEESVPALHKFYELCKNSDYGKVLTYNG